MYHTREAIEVCLWSERAAAVAKDAEYPGSYVETDSFPVVVGRIRGNRGGVFVWRCGRERE